MIFATTKEKILQYLDFKDITLKTFFKETGIKRGFLDSDKLKATVTDIIIAKIIETYPDINIVWLITDKGEMIKEPTDYELKTVENLKNEQIETESSNIKEIANLKSTIKMLQEERDFLRGLLKPPRSQKNETA